MITVNFARPWNVFAPVVYRYLDAEHVDAFFDDGSLRLSSFARFAQHKDEQRLDEHEGASVFVHRRDEGEIKTVIALTSHGRNAYVLCGSTRFDQVLQAKFQRDSYIRIDNSVGFGEAVARQLAGYTDGLEGLCVYQNSRTIEGKVEFDLDSLMPRPEATIDLTEFNRVVNSAQGHLPFFLKEKSFADQAEYRLLWLIDRDADAFIDIKVPDARQYCSRPNEVME